jgi:deoxyribonuclease-4
MTEKSKILVGPAGSGGSSEEGFIVVKNSGLDAVEIEFTYSIWMDKKQAEKIAELNKKLNLKLSIHAPYYINLNSEDKRKIEASKKRILKCCEIGNSLGVKYIVFHPGFYQKDSKEKTFENIKKQILEMQKEIRKNKWRVELAPETTGKASQFGSLEELVKMKKETDCSICIDFSHLKARENGKISYQDMAEKISKAHLGHIHCHFSGIEFTEKGERRHLITGEKEIKELFSALKKHNIDCTIINESPDPLGDAMKMKRLLR